MAKKKTKKKKTGKSELQILFMMFATLISIPFVVVGFTLDLLSHLVWIVPKKVMGFGKDISK